MHMYIHVYMCWIVYIIISSRTYEFTATVADLYNLNYIVVVLYTSVRTTLYLHTYIHARAITYLYERPNVEPNVTFRTRLITVTFRSGDIILLSCYIKHGQEEKLLKITFISCRRIRNQNRVKNVFPTPPHSVVLLLYLYPIQVRLCSHDGCSFCSSFHR